MSEEKCFLVTLSLDADEQRVADMIDMIKGVVDVQAPTTDGVFSGRAANNRIRSEIKETLMDWYSSI